MGKYNIEFDEQYEARLEELKEQLGAKTKAEVIRRAITLLSALGRKDKSPQAIEMLSRVLQDQA